MEVPRAASFGQVLPKVDVIVCTVVEQVPECFLQQQAPVVLFEQGDSYLFEFDKLDAQEQDYFKQLWSFPVPNVVVSSVLVSALQRNFGRGANVLPNALNNRVFYPRTEQPESPSSPKPRILFLGQENHDFKGIPLIREALRQVRQTGREFGEVWVSPTAPASDFDGELIVNPSQETLGNVYRSCDIFVSGSYYESFSLPPLEAMACGCAVVSTHNQGVQEYAVNGHNCLLGQIGDPTSLAERIIDLLDHPEKRNRLVLNGYQTASSYKWEAVMQEWETYLSGVIHLWNTQNAQTVPLTLRIEQLPKGLLPEQVRARIHEIQNSMQEDWCLWLVAGESIEEESVASVKRALQIGLPARLTLQVHYESDVPEHPIVRREDRLFRRGEQQSPPASERFTLPVSIVGGSESYFLPPWLSELRDAYVTKQYQEMITLAQKRFPELSAREQLVAIKWLVLALLELNQFQQALSLIQEGLQMDGSYSDLLYLYSRIAMILNRPDLSKPILESASLIGTAWHYDDSFLEMKKLCELYL
ncbi:hypothetical protein EL26_06260 [Tumebacillus flagellatus]|uniref:Glycosyl transferase family 1 domain-containing protein n=1 Tax=Tumebacillus flagellatus TaxID=1157490 RepID=A0A074LVK4_9BACL|nr:hypothetical protein EL26_06260 [Tumebacillus flagellatus]